MTEAEWRVSDDALQMLAAVKATASDRKLRLLAIGWFHRAVAVLRDRSSEHLQQRFLDAVAVAEQFAEGLPHVTAADLERAHWEVQIGLGWPTYALQSACDGTLSPYAWDAVNVVMSDLEDMYWSDTDCVTESQCIRCVFGNPFRPVALEPSWLTSTVVALAEGIYQERAFDRLPILADALMDAGCDNADVLDHCRGDGPHVRGCWVVDLLTGRA